MMNEDFPIKKFHLIDMCIKCDKNGELLTCHDNGCPVVVHKDCLGSEAYFDEMGNFYCPFCVYKRAIQEFTQAERKAVLAEKTLSKYLDGKGIGAEAFETVNVNGSSDGNQCVNEDCHEVTSPECTRKEKETDVLVVNKENDVLVLLNRNGENGGLNDDTNRFEVLEKKNELERVAGGRGDRCCSGEGKVDEKTDVDMNKQLQSGDKIQNDGIQTETLTKDHQDAGRFKEHKIREVNVEAVEENEGRIDEVRNKEQAHKTTYKIGCKESAPQVHMGANRKVDDTTASTCIDTSTISKKVTGAQKPCVNTSRRSSGMKKSVHFEKSNTPTKSSKVAPPPIFMELPTLKEKRRRSAWKVEEEEMLKKGVHQYSKSVNKKLPWQKILEDGRAVFDETRNPADLKDKWRNMLSKEPLLELS